MTPHPRAFAGAIPDKPTLIIADSGLSPSYATLVERSDQAVHLIASMGLCEGGTIAILL